MKKLKDSKSQVTKEAWFLDMMDRYLKRLRRLEKENQRLRKMVNE